MRVLVTGSRGFIGRYVMKELEKQGHIPLHFDAVDGFDIRDKGEVAVHMNNADAVIHLAGLLGTHELYDNIPLAIDVNVKGAYNVLAACAAQHRKPFVMIEQPHIWFNPYEATKGLAHRLAMAYAYDFGVPVAFVETYNAFGPYQHHGEGHPQKIIPTFANAAWNGEAIPIWGDGEQKVDLVAAPDVADALVRAIGFASDDTPTLYAGTGQALTVNEVADYVRDYVREQGGVKSPPPKHHTMRRGENTEMPAVSPYEDYPMRWDYLDYTIEWYRMYPNGTPDDNLTVEHFLS